MTKRLKYTKDILTHMLNNNGNNQKTATQSSRRTQESDRRPLNILNVGGAAVDKAN